MRRRGPAIRPFAARGRRAIAAILLTFALFSTLGIVLSTRTTARMQHRASVLEVAARQRTLAERYVQEVLLVRAGKQADPATTAVLLANSARVLIDGGAAPAVNGDDDEAVLPPATEADVRARLNEERRLVADLTATGRALLAGRPVQSVRLTGRERIAVTDPVQRLRILAALTSNVSLDAAGSIAAGADRSVNHLITVQVVFGIAGLLLSIGLGLGLIAATRRQTAHFRSLVTSSTDLVLVFGADGCRYVSDSVASMLGRREAEILGDGFVRYVHDDDRTAVEATLAHGKSTETVFRVLNRFGEWRHVEAHVTDLRADREIRGIVLNARDITDRVQLEEQLTRQAFHDGLTALPNRALFRDRLDHALSRSARSGDHLAVLLVDLDGFKQVNDSLGHGAGDELLQQVSHRFSQTIRDSETLARLGGDEFALLLEDTDEPRAVAVARRLLDALTEPAEIAGRELSVGASIGIVMHPGGPGESEEMIRHADVAMYAAKEAGRRRFEVFRHDMARELGELLGLEHELRLALQRDELTVHYQPEISLDTGTIIGVEALLRWNSPSRGMVPPAQFIPIAEATELIVPLGEFVLRAACEQTSEWKRAGVLPDSFITWVNVSGKQLSAGGISEQVRKALEAASLAPEHLGIEVTETAIVTDGGGRVLAELADLRGLGVRIAIDDFGTGFSSLGQLRRFPVDMIKVDRSFVQGVETSSKDAAIARNVISLAHALGLVALAEGIETDGQRESLRALGCDHAQGFLFARPAPADEIGRILASRDALAGPDSVAA